MRAIEVKIKRHQNEGTGETVRPRENPPSNGIVRQDSHLLKFGNPVGVGGKRVLVVVLVVGVDVENQGYKC
ncbi:hypothetical protein PR048_005493 [Dryococelus australis]|uniref:Uncharacterized protein n=1 Tax=Dryococelus australis TaxID=614101 RepID=A0ABQ9I8X4_9NEOP|nr:hypothetical protein PR048_005493 [Dryococelus australis]